MKKLIFLLLFLPFFAKAQIIPPVNDSTAIGTPGAAFTPSFRVITYGGKTLFQGRVGTSTKWMTLSTTQYNRNYLTNTASQTKLDSIYARVVNLYDNQTIGGNKTYTGTTTMQNLDVVGNVTANYGNMVNLDVTSQVSAATLSLLAGANRTNFGYGNYLGGAFGMKIYTPAVSTDNIVIIGNNIYGNNIPFLKQGDTSLTTNFASKDTLSNFIDTAYNGLTKEGTAVKLGGDLTGSTSVNLLNYNLNMNGVANDTTQAKFQLQTVNHGASDPRFLLELSEGTTNRTGISGTERTLDLYSLGSVKTSAIHMQGDTIKMSGMPMYDTIPAYTDERQFAAIRDVVSVNNTKIIAGDSTRNGIFTVVGSSVTKGPPNGVAYNDSTYLVKYSNLQGMRVNNYGLSGRALQQITVGDSSAYSKRLLTPTYTTGSYIGCECLINDAQRDSTVYTIATYTTQLTAWVDAQIAAGYPANHILLFNAAYFNNPAAATYPFVENRHDQYAAAMLAVATAKGTLFYDGYYTFKTLYTATPSLLDVSVLHPTDAGTTIVANAMYDYLKTYIPTISDANPKLLISGSGESYFNFTVGNYLKFKNTPSPLLPNSTQPLLAYDATDKRVKTKTIYPVDVYNIWGVPGNTGVNDFNDASNAKPGFAGTLLTGNSAPNGPTTNSGSYQVQTVDYSGTTAHTGAGNVTQLAWPYTSATSQTNGFWYRGRTSGNVFSSWIHLMGSSALSGAGQIPIGQTGGVYTNTTLTGVIAVDAAGATTFAASPTFTGATATLNNSSNGTTQIISTNTNAGTAADARLTASNGTVSFGTIIRGTGFTSNANNGFLNLTGTGSIGFLLNSTERLRMLTSGNTGWGVTTPTAQIHIKAGTATAGTAPIKLTAGTNLTAVEAGAIEFDGTRYYASTTGVRNTVAYLTDAPTLLQLSASGNGSSTTISIAHGLTGISATSKVIVQPINAASAGISYITSDATNINIVYTVAPASGTNNLTYNISIKP